MCGMARFFVIFRIVSFLISVNSSEETTFNWEIDVFHNNELLTIHQNISIFEESWVASRDICLRYQIKEADCNTIQQSIDSHQRVQIADYSGIRGKTTFFSEKGLYLSDSDGPSHLRALYNKMVKEQSECNGSSYFLVTAFYDIGGDNWHHFNKPSTSYIEYLSYLLRANIPLIVFLDDRYTSELLQKNTEAKQNINHQNVFVIPINASFLENHIGASRYIKQMQSIMASPEYINLASLRNETNTPETQNVNYVIINAAKVDFVKYVVDNRIGSPWINASYFGWIDSGYIRNEFEIPFKFHILSHLCQKRINVVVNSKTIIQFANPVVSAEMAINSFNFTKVFVDSIVDITGGFWFGEISILPQFYELFYKCFEKMLSDNIVDDDQSLLMCCYYSKPQLFSPWRTFHYLNIPDRYQGTIIALYAFNSIFNSIPTVSQFVETNVRLNALSQL